MKPAQRPVLAVLLLRVVFHGEALEAILGDIDEEFKTNIQPYYSQRAAREWYWQQAINSVTAKFAKPDVRRGAALTKGERLMQSLKQDLRYGLRVFFRNPGFAATAILTLALGIGANTTIFSIVNAVLLRPLPFPQADRVMAINSVNMKTDPTGGGASSLADFNDWAERTKTFEHIAVETAGGGTLTSTPRPIGLRGARVTEDFFNVLRVNPMLGRTFVQSEFSRSSNLTVVLSYRIWQTVFVSDPAIVGKSIRLDTAETTVVGVMPADFKEPSTADIWTPLGLDTGEEKARGSRYMSVIGRLKPGVTVEQAQSEMSSIASQLEQQYPDSNSLWSVRVAPLQADRVRQIRPALLILLAAVVFVLLISCANVTSLLLARATARYKEIAVRSALGASRGRLIQQLLTESVLLSLIGGGLGLLIAFWGVTAIPKLLPKEIGLPRLSEVRVDSSVLAFTVVVSLATGIIFGLVPSLHVSRQNLSETLKQDGRSASAGHARQKTRNLLVVVEIALALVLLVGGGLLLRSFQQLTRTHLGFDSQNLTVINISLSPYGSFEKWSNYYHRMLDNLSAVPGVESATLNASAPLAGFNMGFPFNIETKPTNPNDQPFAYYSSIAPNYFHALRIPLLRGREFTDHDNLDAPGVAIINESLARQYFTEQEAIGKRIQVVLGVQPLSVEIVGVVADTKQMSVADVPQPEVYVSYLQNPWLYSMILVRTKAEPSAMIAPIQQAIWSQDKNQSLGYIKTMEQMESESVAQPRFYALLLGLFALIALGLAVIGIYGVISYSVAQRTHEIGIRMALGAQRNDLLAMIVRQGMTLAAIGIAIGLVVSLGLPRVMSGLLYKVSPTDAVTFIGISALLSLTALLACFVPAYRATKIDQMAALRYD